MKWCVVVVYRDGRGESLPFRSEKAAMKVALIKLNVELKMAYAGIAEIDSVVVRPMTTW